jgi:cell division protein FtsB
MARKSKKDVQTQPEVPVNEALPDDVIALQKEIKDLRAQLTKAEIKAEAFDELINVAEAQFGIQIRKKAGAKQ